VEVIGASASVLQKDAFDRSMAFLKSLLMFVEHGFCLERRNHAADGIYNNYRDLLRMCR